MHVVVHQSRDPSSIYNVASIFCNRTFEATENTSLTHAFALEQMKQKDMIEDDLNDTSVYLQRFPWNTIRPSFIVQFLELETKYMLLENNGVSQWYFQGNSCIDRFACLPPGAALCQHGFFSEDLVPVTPKTLRDIYALYDAANPERKCKDKPSHRHYRFHIYLQIDMSMAGPWGGNTKYMVVSACEDTMIANLFRGIGGGAAMKNEHLLRNFSWGSSVPGQVQAVLVTGVPYCFGTVKNFPLTLSEIGWSHDEGVVWLYPCKLVKG